MKKTSLLTAAFLQVLSKEAVLLSCDGFLMLQGEIYVGRSFEVCWARTSGTVRR